MSRVGRKPLEIPKSVKFTLQGEQVEMQGPKGKVALKLHPRVTITQENSVVTVQVAGEEKFDHAIQGTTRSLLSNMVKGVTDGFSKELAIEGVGFKAQVQGKELQLLLGFTHPVVHKIPEGLTVETPKPTNVLIKGVDKAKVGQFAAEVRAAYEVEPYKGKGIRYVGQYVRRKAGKTVTK